MYYAPKKTQAGKYGADAYSVSSSGAYTPSASVQTQIPSMTKRSSACCGRGCKPCVDDF